MLTLDEARKIQKVNESKAILKLLVSTAIIGIISFLLFCFTDIISVSSVFYLLPFIMLIIAVKISGANILFKQKEFMGKVIKIHIYRVREQQIAGDGSAANPRADKFCEAEIIAQSANGKTVIQTFRNGDVTSNLSEGDEIAILRFIDEPVVIKGKYWNR